MRLTAASHAPRQPFRFLRGSAEACWLVALLLPGWAACTFAQTTVTSVRENEFRSRWADYQVDRTQQSTDQTTPGSDTDDSGGLLSAFGRSFNDHFRNGPLQLRADLSVGWEFTNEDNLRRSNPGGTDNSPFVSPALGVFYNLEIGPSTLSARYSAGYVYYVDQSYYAAGHQGGILSQTGGLDLSYAGNRTTLRSTTSAAYGDGNDIESGAFRDRLQVGETLNVSYLVTDFTQVGSDLTFSSVSYRGGGVPDSDDLGISGTVYGDYVITGKSRLRLELGAGDDHQTIGRASNSDRGYYQFELKTNYVASAKFTFDVGLGVGYQQNSAVVDQTDGFHPVYSIDAKYVPTEKTSLSLHFGYEGTDIEPDFSFQVQYQPRPNTTVNLSLYQNNNFSTYIIAQNLTTRGVLATIQQHLFEKVELDLSSGAEQTRGFVRAGTPGNLGSPGIYYFASISMLWQFNPALALQAYYRGFSGEPGATSQDQGWQSRASISLRLTF